MTVAFLIWQGPWGSMKRALVQPTTDFEQQKKLFRCYPVRFTGNFRKYPILALLDTFWGCLGAETLTQDWPLFEPNYCPDCLDCKNWPAKSKRAIFGFDCPSALGLKTAIIDFRSQLLQSLGWKNTARIAKLQKCINWVWGAKKKQLGMQKLQKIDFGSSIFAVFGQKRCSDCSECSYCNNWLCEPNYCNNWVNYCSPISPTHENKQSERYCRDPWLRKLSHAHRDPMLALIELRSQALQNGNASQFSEQSEQYSGGAISEINSLNACKLERS